MYPKGGHPLPSLRPDLEAAREALCAWMGALPEGEVFTRAQALEALDGDGLEAFDAIQGFDHFALPQGFHAAVREGRYVRTIPDPERTARSWCAAVGWGEPVAFGDWTGWQDGLAIHEPLAGRRFRVDMPGADATLSLGRARVRVLHGLPWLMDPTPAGRVARALCDLPHKTIDADLARWAAGPEQTGRRALVETAIAILDEANDDAWRTAKGDGRGWRPQEAAASARAAMERLGWRHVAA